MYKIKPKNSQKKSKNAFINCEVDFLVQMGDKFFPTFFPHFLCFKGLEIISFDNENNIFGKI